MFNTPILFLIFNRPQQTKLVFEKIREVQPKFLFVAADGARLGIEGEQDRCISAREIATAVDWDCTVLTHFRGENLGCKIAVSDAINWFFSYVEEGIILEDDCIPSIPFFHYCEILLERFRHDARVISINGCNYGYDYAHASYFFSRYMNVWGWATWRRVANSVSYNIPEWLEMNKFEKFKFLQSRLRLSFIDLDIPWSKYWISTFDSIADDTLNTWDFFWLYHQFKNRLGAVLPAVNLVKNIGFNENATHTTFRAHPAASLKINDLSYPITHNNNFKFNIDYEQLILQPICYMYNRKPNSFYIKRWLTKVPIVASIVKLKRRL